MNQQKRPLLVTVFEKAWQLACQIMQERYAFLEADNTLQYSAQRHKICEWLLRHYAQRRTLEGLHLPDLTLTFDELELYSSPNILFDPFS
jgi:hypothetical protein